MSRKIAIVEDEVSIRENYADALRRHGYEVGLYANQEEAMKAFHSRLPDLVLLDIGLEDEMDAGFEICRELRNMSATLPVIFLTARDSDLDTISGLRLGADDYLTKDISLPHLIARISALFRRMDVLSRDISQESLVKRESLLLDMNRFEAKWKNEHVDLTLTEFWVVHTLAQNPGHVKNREQLMQNANIYVDDSTITSHIKRIRNKFCTIDPAFDSINTVYGMGYSWKLK